MAGAGTAIPDVTWWPPTCDCPLVPLDRKSHLSMELEGCTALLGTQGRKCSYYVRGTDADSRNC